MNYGKKSVSKKRNSLISRTAMMGKRAHVSLIRVLFVILITICVVIGCTGIGAFRGIIDNAPDVNDIDISPLGYATFLYDGDGNQLRKLTAPSSNRLPVSIDQIPVDLQHAVVAIEDERFYEHNGIDVRGILRAFVKNLSSGNLSEGASTITQQLLKNNVFTNWTQESTWLERFTRKIQGQFAPGSMLPKVQAAMDFAASDAERTAMITLLEKAKDGILGKTGTRIHM